MCDTGQETHRSGVKTVAVQQAVGTVLAHDITEIRKGEFKGAAFRKGHVIRQEDVCHLQRLGKEHLFVLRIAEDEMHEDDAAGAVATALMGEGVEIKGEPREGKITIVAARDGLLKVDADTLTAFNMLGEVMCATLHTDTVVRKGQDVAGTRAIPLVLKKLVVEEAVKLARNGHHGTAVAGQGVIRVKELRRPRAGIVITGNEVYHGRIKDAFAPVITKKIEAYQGEVVGVYYAPDDMQFIEDRLRELVAAGADLLITTGGMSVDPDDVTRFAVRHIGATDITYGSAVLPGAMFLIAYLPIADFRFRNGEFQKASPNDGVSANRDQKSELIPVMGIPACGMYHKTTIFDLILPMVLAGESIGRRELAELGHGGLCMNCDVCRYPVCPFGKD